VHERGRERSDRALLRAPRAQTFREGLQTANAGKGARRIAAARSGEERAMYSALSSKTITCGTGTTRHRLSTRQQS